MKHWVEAARVRTLPLSVSGIIVGSFYAMSQGIFNWNIVIFALLTTLGLQILSNFANDYGDFKNGADNTERIGPKRAVQSGVISASQMKNAISRIEIHISNLILDATLLSKCNSSFA
jgi:1,4-dihydroxy-2-naphthoate octaprenyltransferase